MKKFFLILFLLLMSCDSSIDVSSYSCNQTWEPMAPNDNICGVCVRSQCSRLFFDCIADISCQEYNSCQENGLSVISGISCTNDVSENILWNDMMNCVCDKCCDICSENCPL